MTSSGNNSHRDRAKKASLARRTRHRPVITVAIVLLVFIVAVILRRWSDGLPEPNAAQMSLQQMEQRARADPNNPQAQLDWADRLSLEGSFEKAQVVYDHACHLAPKDARPFAGRARVAFALRRPQEAQSLFQDAIQRDPNDPELWRGLAQVYEHLHSSKEAMATYLRLTQLRPQEPRWWRQLGIHYARLGSWLPSRNALKRAVELDPSDVSALHHLGLVSIRQGRLAEAKEALDRAIILEPNHPSVLMLEADLILLMDSSPKALIHAEELINRSLAQGITGPRHQMRGRIYLAQRSCSKAIEEFQSALRLDPSLVNTHVYLSQAYALNGQPELARNASREYMKNRLERPKDLTGEEAQQ